LPFDGSGCCRHNRANGGASAQAKEMDMAFRLILAVCALFMGPSVLAAEQRFTVGNFDEVIVEGDIIVNLVTGKGPSAIASGPQGKVGALRVERQGMVLRIRTMQMQPNRRETGPVTVSLTGRDIKRLALVGSGKITADSLDKDTVRIEMRGAGVINIANLKAFRLVTMISGNGTLSVAKGEVVNGEVAIDGGASFISSGLSVQNLKLVHNGPASTLLNVSNTAEINNSGAGTITVEGNGVCVIRRAGTGTINCKKVQG
jgi:hypothetical protein